MRSGSSWAGSVARQRPGSPSVPPRRGGVNWGDRHGRRVPWQVWPRCHRPKATYPKPGRTLMTSCSPEQAGAQSGAVYALSGFGEPFLTFWTCCRVLRATADPRAEEILAAAHRRLEAHASQIVEEGLRRSFLEDVAIHREIVGEYARRGQGK